MSSSAPDPSILSANLMARLRQEGKPDLHLRGTDGVEVPGFRLILACSSDVLDRMLCGDFEESSSNVIALTFHSEVLASVVEFCITDEVRPFDSRDEHAAARRMVQLMACAHFYNMPRLQDKAQVLVTSLLDADKYLACTVFDEASLFGELAQSIKLNALCIIRKFPECLLLSTPSGLIIQEDRMSAARSLATSHISLVAIQPTDLTDIVRKSGLVDERVVSESLEALALSAEKELTLGHLSKIRKKTTVTGLRIFGAGTNVANGFYEENGKYRGSPKYTKICLWKGEERTLVVCVCRPLRACLAIVEKDGSIIDDDEHNLYTATNKNGWKKAGLGEEPCPKCKDMS